MQGIWNKLRFYRRHSRKSFFCNVTWSELPRRFGERPQSMENKIPLKERFVKVAWRKELKYEITQKGIELKESEEWIPNTNGARALQGLGWGPAILLWLVCTGNFRNLPGNSDVLPECLGLWKSMWVECFWGQNLPNSVEAFWSAMQISYTVTCVKNECHGHGQ